VLVFLMGVIYNVRLEMASSGMMYIPSFKTIGSDIQVLLRFCLNCVRGCNVGITDGKDLLIIPLRWAHLHVIHTKFHKDLFRHLTFVRGYKHTDTQTARRSHEPTFIFFQIRKAG
jgi:hypothetical protein